MRTFRTAMFLFTAMLLPLGTMAQDQPATKPAPVDAVTSQPTKEKKCCKKHGEKGKEACKKHGEKGKEACKKHGEKGKEACKKHGEKGKKCCKKHGEKGKEARKKHGEKGKKCCKKHGEKGKEACKKHGEKGKKCCKKHGEKGKEACKKHGGMMDRCKAMMAGHKDMVAQMESMDGKLAGLVAAMNELEGEGKTKAMAAVLTELIRQRKVLRDQLAHSMHGMAKHMMHHVKHAMKGEDSPCPMMKGPGGMGEKEAAAAVGPTTKPSK